MADAIKNYNPKKSREYLNLALSCAKNTFPEFKESYKEEITKKLKELDDLIQKVFKDFLYLSDKYFILKYDF